MDQLCGVIYLSTSKIAEVFSTEDLELVTAIGIQAARVALDPEKQKLPWLKFFMGYDPAVALKKVRIPTLYIQAVDDPELAETTRQLFLKAPEPREQAVLPHGNFVSFNDDEKRAYENRVVSFFLVRLPATAMAVR